MKKQFKFFAMSLAATAMFVFSSCNGDDYFIENGIDDVSARAIEQGDFYIVNFDEAGTVMAGPTSYGENLYDGYKEVSGYPRFTFAIDPLSGLNYGLNESGWGGSYNYWNGGVAVSNWNYRSNISGKSGDWWSSYLNQCSVYNVNSADGANKNAGHSGNNFAVLYGYTDTFSGFISSPQMSLGSRTERTFDHMYVCNSSYTVGVVANGNSFTNGSLINAKGYFKLVVRGYKRGSTTPVATDEIYLADYRNGKKVLIDKWTKFDLVNIKKQKINRIEFDYDGSDSGDYGLNTPAYVCVDDIAISVN